MAEKLVAKKGATKVEWTAVTMIGKTVAKMVFCLVEVRVE